MPANMINPDSGLPCRVIGTSNEIAADGPSPGNTPTKVPMRTPKKQYKRLMGFKAILKPNMIPCRLSILLPRIPSYPRALQAFEL